MGNGKSATSWSKPSQAVVLFLRGHTTRTAGPTAVVVGTVLSAVNQGGVLEAGQASPSTWLRIAVNYIVPFIVASIGYLSASRTRPEEVPDTRVDG